MVILSLSLLYCCLYGYSVVIQLLSQSSLGLRRLQNSKTGTYRTSTDYESIMTDFNVLL